MASMGSDIAARIRLEASAASSVTKVITSTEQQFKSLGKTAKDTSTQMGALSDKEERAARATKDLGEAATHSAENMRKMYQESDNATDGIARLGAASFAVNNIITGLTKVSGRMVNVMKDIVLTSSVFEQKMANVGTLMSSDVTPRVKELSAAVIELSKEFGVAADQLGLATYQALSAGITDTRDAVETLEAATKLSIGALGTMEESMKILAASTNAFGFAAGSTTEIANVMQLTVRQGVTTVGQLSQAFGAVASIAAQAGISLREMSAATAALTTAGFDTATAQQNLRQAIVSVLAPNAKMVELFRRIGVESGQALIATNGFVGAFDKLRAAAGDSGYLKEAIGRVQGFSAAMSLTGLQGDKFRETMALMATEVGALDDAVKTATDTFEVAANQFQAAQDSLKIRVMKEANGAIILVTKGLTWMVTAIETLIDKLGIVGSYITGFVGALAVVVVGLFAAIAAVGTFGLQLALLNVALVQSGLKAWTFSRAIVALTNVMVVKPVTFLANSVLFLGKTFLMLINPMAYYRGAMYLNTLATLVFGSSLAVVTAYFTVFVAAAVAGVALVYVFGKALWDLAKSMGASWEAMKSFFGEVKDGLNRIIPHLGDFISLGWLMDGAKWGWSWIKGLGEGFLGLGTATMEAEEGVESFEERLKSLGDGAIFTELAGMATSIREAMAGTVAEDNGGFILPDKAIEGIEQFRLGVERATEDLNHMAAGGDRNTALRALLNSLRAASEQLGENINDGSNAMNYLKEVLEATERKWFDLTVTQRSAADGIFETVEAQKKLRDEVEKSHALETGLYKARADAGKTVFDLALKQAQIDGTIYANQEKLAALATDADARARISLEHKIEMQKKIVAGARAHYEEESRTVQTALAVQDMLLAKLAMRNEFTLKWEKALKGAKTEAQQIADTFKKIEKAQSFDQAAADSMAELAQQRVATSEALEEGLVKQNMLKKAALQADLDALEVASRTAQEKLRGLDNTEEGLRAQAAVTAELMLIDEEVATINAQLEQQVSTVKDIAEAWRAAERAKSGEFFLAESGLEVDELRREVLENTVNISNGELLTANQALLDGTLRILEAERQIELAALAKAGGLESGSAEAQIIADKLTIVELKMIRATQEAAKFKQELTGATFNIGKSFNAAFEDLIKGLAQGTAEIEDIFDNLSDAITASFAKAFSDALMKKFEFDDIFISNIFGLGDVAVEGGEKIGEGMGKGTDIAKKGINEVADAAKHLQKASERGFHPGTPSRTNFPAHQGGGPGESGLGILPAEPSGFSMGGLMQAAGIGMAAGGLASDLGASSALSGGIGGAAGGLALGLQVTAIGGPVGMIVGAIVGVIIGAIMGGMGPSESDLVRRHFDKFFERVFSEFNPGINIERDISRRGFTLEDERFQNFSGSQQSQIKALAVLASGTIDNDDVGAAKNYRIAVAQLTDGFDKSSRHFQSIAQALAGSLTDGTFGDAVETYIANLKALTQDFGNGRAVGKLLAGVDTVNQGSNENFIVARDAGVLDNIQDGLKALFDIIFADAADSVKIAALALSRRIEADVLRDVLADTVNFEQADPSRTARHIEAGLEDAGFEGVFDKMKQLFKAGKFQQDGEALSGKGEFVQLLADFARGVQIRLTNPRGNTHDLSSFDAAGAYEGSGFQELTNWLNDNFAGIKLFSLPEVIQEGLDSALSAAGSELDPEKKDAFDARLEVLLGEFMSGSEQFASTADILKQLNLEFGLDLQLDDFLDAEAMGAMAQRLAELALQAFAMVTEGFGKAAAEFLVSKDMEAAQKQFSLSLSETMAEDIQTKLSEVFVKRGPFAGIQEDAEKLLSNVDKQIHDIMTNEDLTSDEALSQIDDIIGMTAAQFENLAAQAEMMGPAIEKFAEMQEKVILAFTTFNMAADQVEAFQDNIKKLMIEFGGGDSVALLNEEAKKKQKAANRAVSTLFKTRGTGDISALSDEDLKRMVLNLEAAANAIAEAGRAEIAALEERLRLTQLWVDMLPKAREILEDIRGSGEGDQADEFRERDFRLDADRLGSLIGQFNASDGEQKAAIAAKILDLAPNVLERGRNLGLDISGIEHVLDSVLSQIVTMGVEAENEQLTIQKEILAVQERIRSQLEFLNTTSEAVMTELRDRIGKGVDDVARETGPNGPAEATATATDRMAGILNRGINVAVIKGMKDGYPSYSQGGVFTEPEGLAMLHGPEAIIPLDRLDEFSGGGGGGTVVNQEMNITFTGGAAPRALTAEERMQLEREQRRMARDPSIRALRRR